MSDPMTERMTAAAMHGMATNRAYSTADRLECALEALTWYEANLTETEQAAALTSPSEPAHPEARCHCCGGPNIVWAAPSPLWNAAMREGGTINGLEAHHGIVCPICFAAIAEGLGIADTWRLTAVNVSALLETVTPSGRVWDERTWLWSDSLSVSVEPVPSTPRVPGSTERPEGILAGLTVNERFYLAMHARYESQRQDDFRYQHADPAERERLRSRWSQIAAALEVEETNDGRE